MNKRTFGDITESNNLLFEVTKSFKFKAHEVRAVVNDTYKTSFLLGKYTYEIRNSLSSYIDEDRYFFTNRKEALKFIEENSDVFLLRSLAAEIAVLRPHIDNIEYSDTLTRIDKYIEKLNHLTTKNHGH